MNGWAPYKGAAVNVIWKLHHPKCAENRRKDGPGNCGLPSHRASRKIHNPTCPSIKRDFSPTSCRCLCCFHQQETQNRTALLGDVSQSLMADTGVLRRNQSDIAADLLAKNG